MLEHVVELPEGQVVVQDLVGERVDRMLKGVEDEGSGEDEGFLSVLPLRRRKGTRKMSRRTREEERGGGTDRVDDGFGRPSQLLEARLIEVRFADENEALDRHERLQETRLLRSEKATASVSDDAERRRGGMGRTNDHDSDLSPCQVPRIDRQIFPSS